MKAKKRKAKRVKRAWATFKKLSARFNRVGQTSSLRQFKELAKLTQNALRKVEREEER